MNTSDVLRETALILRGDHPNYTGDRILNAESYLYKISQRSAKQAKNIAADINNFPEVASEISSLHPTRCTWIANRLNENL